jgi:preprotein translocase subunit SecB
MADKEKSDKGKSKKADKEAAEIKEPTLDAPAAEGGDEAVGVEPADQETSQATAPQIGIQSQYVKDLSFENPGAPGTLVASEAPPDIQVNVEVQARPLQNDNYEVALHITASGKNGQTTLFMLDLTYGAVCRVVGVPKESIQPVLLVECPRLLFPFARRVLSDATRDGGFPPLMLNPIDFLSLFRQQQQQAQAAAASKADA